MNSLDMPHTNAAMYQHVLVLLNNMYVGATSATYKRSLSAGSCLVTQLGVSFYP